MPGAGVAVEGDLACVASPVDGVGGRARRVDGVGAAGAVDGHGIVATAWTSILHDSPAARAWTRAHSFILTKLCRGAAASTRWKCSA